jgi:hypothetical protein
MKSFFAAILIIIFFISCNKNKTISEAGELNYQKAKKFRELNKTDSAFYYYNIAKNYYTTNGDSLETGKSLVNMAMIQTNNGDYLGGIESSLEANKYLKRVKDSTTRSTLATNYNNIALSFNFLKNPEKSFEFYSKTLEYVDNDESRYLCYNNIADALITQKKFRLAERFLQKAILSRDSVNQAKALNNLAKAKYLGNKSYNPLSQLHKSLKIRIYKNDLQGLNSSYETFSEYFTNKNRDSALFYAKKMLETANTIKIPNDQLIALKKIIELEPQDYLSNFRKYTSINSDLQINRNKAKNQFAIIRFDVEKLKADNAEKDFEGLQKNVGIAALVLTLIGGLFYYKKRKKRLQQEKQLEVKNTELKYSKKVHDVVANGLYHLMIDIDNNPDINKVKILNDMEKMYEESRDISHDKSTEIDFHERFGKMINSYSTADQKVILTKYAENIWENIPQNTQSELFYVVREFLVNMKKHSEAKMVVLKFEKDNNILYITYTDNGKGIKNLATQRGSGIRNTENRIDTIGGDIIFEENPNGGLIIKITIPIHSKYV